MGKVHRYASWGLSPRSGREPVWGPWEPTVRTVDVPEVWMMRLVAGKIAEIGHVWGGREFIEQLGVTLAPAPITG
jgi:hypothetical protein